MICAVLLGFVNITNHVMVQMLTDSKTTNKKIKKGVEGWFATA